MRPGPDRTVQKTGPLWQHYPLIADGVRAANDRRNKLPESHPFDEKTGDPTIYLKPAEQRQLATQLARVFRDVAGLL